MHVLVVEDEKRLAEGLRMGLAAEGMAVDVALNGDDGLWMARENAYDAIVLDIMLPGVNGYKSARPCATKGVGHPSSCSLPRTASGTRWKRWTPAPTTF